MRMGMLLKKTENSLKSKNLIVPLLISFVLLMLSTGDFVDFSLEDLRILLILSSATGILLLVDNVKLNESKRFMARLQFYLFFTAMIMSLLILFSLLEETIQAEAFSNIIIQAIKPLMFALILHLPAVSLLERIDKKVTPTKKEKALQVEEILTRRELEIYKLATKNLTNKEMAEQLFIAEATVKKHVQNIYKKLECKSKDELGKICNQI